MKGELDGANDHGRIWLLKLQPLLPAQCQLDGFDISPALFPPPDKRSSMSFYTHNALAPFPERFLGKYDVVHVRLLVFVLAADQWTVVLQSLAHLLSAYIQLAVHETMRVLILEWQQSREAISCGKTPIIRVRERERLHRAQARGVLKSRWSC